MRSLSSIYKQENAEKMSVILFTFGCNPFIRMIFFVENIQILYYNKINRLCIKRQKSIFKSTKDMKKGSTL